MIYPIPLLRGGLPDLLSEEVSLHRAGRVANVVRSMFARLRDVPRPSHPSKLGGMWGLWTIAGVRLGWYPYRQSWIGSSQTWGRTEQGFASRSLAERAAELLQQIIPDPEDSRFGVTGEESARVLLLDIAQVCAEVTGSKDHLEAIQAARERFAGGPCPLIGNFHEMGDCGVCRHTRAQAKQMHEEHSRLTHLLCA